MADKFLRREKTNDSDKKIIKSLDFDTHMFKKVEPKTEEDNQIKNNLKGLSEFSFGNDPVLVPLQRTEFNEIMIALKNMSVTIEELLKQTGDIEKNILLTENNNNISDSETKKFIEMTINKSLEQFKNFIMAKFTKDFETLKDEEIDDLEPNDIIIIVKNAPSKQMLKISSDTANDIINDILGKGGQCYITDNMNKSYLSEQIREINKTEILERKEDTSSRQQRIHINFTSSEEEDEEEKTQENQ
jgi:hypothetical protein